MLKLESRRERAVVSQRNRLFHRLLERTIQKAESQLVRGQAQLDWNHFCHRREFESMHTIDDVFDRSPIGRGLSAGKKHVKPS